jgi:hypothetical protein
LRLAGTAAARHIRAAGTTIATTRQHEHDEDGARGRHLQGSFQPDQETGPPASAARSGFATDWGH